MTTPTTEPARHLGRYELVHLLGQGGMGEVYLAKISGAAGFEKPCIVKTILPTLLKDSQFLDRFHHEAKVLVHLVHSSIAQVYDMGEANGTYYMALEYVAGVDVSYLAEQARNQGQAIPAPVALYIGQKVAEGLGYAHRKAGPDGSPLGIVHRDVSPHNVMLSYEGEVKVIDFGLAKSAARSKYTLPSTVMGKLGYMSPEQARAEPLDHRSDIYSAGVMIWELLAGRQLVAHGTVGEMMAAMANPHVPALHELRQDVTPAIDAVVRRALAPNPQDRYGRADELARALNEQLLRSSSALGAEEVGNFVKALCPEAFSAQRKLISRISGVRRSPSTPPNAGVMPASGPAPMMGAEPITGLEATSLRPLGEAQEPGLSATLRPMATPLPGAPISGSMSARRPAGSGPIMSAPSMSAPHPVSQSGAMAPAGVSNSRLVAIALILFVMMIGTAGATVYFMGGKGTPAAAVAQGPQGYPPPPEGMPYPPPPGGPMGGPPPGGPMGGPPPGGPMGGPPPGGPMGGPPRGPMGGPMGGPPGGPPGSPSTDVASASGSEGTAAAAPAVGTVGSVAVAPAVAQMPGAGDEDTATRKDPLKRPRRREIEPSELVTVDKVKPLIQRGGTFAVRAGAAAGLKKNMVLKVVGPEQEGGKRKLLGYVTVDDVKPIGSKVLPDNATISSKELSRYVALPEADEAPAPIAEAPPAPPPAPAAPPPPRKLALGVKETSALGLGVMGKGFVINSVENAPLNNCKATIERGLQHRFPRLVRGENKVDRGAFQATQGAAPVRRGWMRIECDEGTQEIVIR